MATKTPTRRAKADRGENNMPENAAEQPQDGASPEANDNNNNNNRNDRKQ